MSPRSWGWALSQVQHSPVLWLKVGKGAEAGAGGELGESRTSDEDDRGPSPWPEGEGLWHVSGRQVSASALAPFSLGHPPWVSWSTLTLFAQDSFLAAPLTAPEHTECAQCLHLPALAAPFHCEHPRVPGSVPGDLSFGDVIAASRILLLSFWSILSIQDSLLELFFFPST